MGPTAALIAVSAAGSIMSGMMQKGQADQQARALDQQARIAMAEGERDAQNKAISVREFQAEQSVLYAKSGFTLEGTPAYSLERTRRQGQEEVDSILSSSYAKSNLIKTQAAQTRTAGRNAMIGGFIKAGTSAATGAMGAKGASLGNTDASYALSIANGLG